MIKTGRSIGMLGRPSMTGRASVVGRASNVGVIGRPSLRVG